MILPEIHSFLPQPIMEPTEVIEHLLHVYIYIFDEPEQNALTMELPLVPLDIIKICQEYAKPYKLSKQERAMRINAKLKQRPSVHDIIMRGILLEHPSIPASLVQRKRHLLKRRASRKVDELLQRRPSQQELEDRNILPKDKFRMPR